ncbi:MAG: class I SAM-dependent methyltransferase [Bacteroidota bacterium]|nr:class I SAM-dependent methyltransferase [Bacteroidota bacterium]
MIFGKQSVLNSAHSVEKYESITSSQKIEIFPYLKTNLSGNERVCLDFGCGPGRFTQDLATLIHGKAIGVDPIHELLDLAIPTTDVEYYLLKKGKIPLPNNSVDIVWCCLVLGGIPEVLLPNTINEILRVLNDDGLLVIIENTSEKLSQSYWMFRSFEFYCSLFPEVSLKKVHQYSDLGETISVMIGRKKVHPIV